MFFVIGLTGGIASGKSTVREWLANKSCEGLRLHVIDADLLGHEAYAVGSACNLKLVEHFGERIKNEDSTINRKVLGSIVFADPAEMLALQSIVWPEISSLLSQRISQAKDAAASNTLVVVEAAVLLEAQWHLQLPFNLLMAVVVDPSVAKQRLMQRNKLSSDDADKRIASQISNDVRIAQVNVTIENNGTTEELQGSLEKVWRDRILSVFD